MKGKRFIQFSNSCEPSIIGSTNGIFQVEFDDKTLENHTDSEELLNIFHTYPITDFAKYNRKALTLKTDAIHGKLIKKAKVTDLMGYSPSFFGCQYIITERIKTFLDEFCDNNNEYNLIPVKLEKIESIFYILIVPFILNSEIDFANSWLHNEENEYLNIDNEEEYKNEFDTYFRKVSIPEKYSNREILNIQGIVDYFISENLANKLNELNLTSFKNIDKIELAFN